MKVEHYPKRRGMGLRIAIGDFFIRIADRIAPPWLRRESEMRKAVDKSFQDAEFLRWVYGEKEAVLIDELEE